MSVAASKFVEILLTPIMLKIILYLTYVNLSLPIQVSHQTEPHLPVLAMLHFKGWEINRVEC